MGEPIRAPQGLFRAYHYQKSTHSWDFVPEGPKFALHREIPDQYVIDFDTYDPRTDGEMPILPLFLPFVYASTANFGFRHYEPENVEDQLLVIRHPKDSFPTHTLGIRLIETISNIQKDYEICTTKSVGTNVPRSDRYELFLLGEGEKKVTWVLDTRKCLPMLP